VGFGSGRSTSWERALRLSYILTPPLIPFLPARSADDRAKRRSRLLEEASNNTTSATVQQRK
jgi:hypothetical protein